MKPDEPARIEEPRPIYFIERDPGSGFGTFAQKLKSIERRLKFYRKHGYEPAVYKGVVTGLVEINPELDQ